MPEGRTITGRNQLVPLGKLDDLCASSHSFRVTSQDDLVAPMDLDSLDTPFGVAMCSATTPPSGTSHASF
jgi:hypothetical protein